MVCGLSAFGTSVFGPLLVGLATFGVGGTTGFSLNPARDLMPRVVYQLIPGIKVSAQWGYSWVPPLEPISVGAMLVHYS